MTNSGVPAPRAAATVLLLRDEAGGGFSVFMVQRSMKSSFMPGAYVFPGGKVDEEDYAAVPSLSEEEAVARFGGTLEGSDALAHLVAAAREVEEEVGIRLADLEDIQVFSHWITPEIETARFDTWFLVIRLPEGADPVHDDHETVASRWIEPASAVASYGEGDLILAPPTYYTLWDLARFATADDVMEEARTRRVVVLQPHFQEIDGRWVILLPGDEAYPSATPVDGPTRIVMGEGGRWWVVDGSAGAPGALVTR